MTNQANEQANQSDELKKLVDQVEKGDSTPESTSADHEVNGEITEQSATMEIDVLNLPPRKEIHNTKRRTRVKISAPFIRLLIVILIIVVVMGGLYYMWEADMLDFPSL